MSAPSGFPVPGSGCDCVWIGNGILAAVCGAHGAWRKSEIAAAIAVEREACARIASGMEGSADCDDRGMQDPETGEVPCSAEARGEVCVCVERSDLAHKIATKIRARGA